MPPVNHGRYTRPPYVDQDGDTLINHKIVRARPGLRRFLREVQDLAHIIVWSSMVLANTEPIVSFLFHGLAPPCLVLGQESCDDLHDERGRPIDKVGGGGGQQFLKVLKSKLWDVVPTLRDVPSGWWPTPLNTLLVDDSPPKSVLNPPGTVIFPFPWKGDMADTFLQAQLGPYIRRLVDHADNFPSFVLANPIGNRPLSPRCEVYKALVHYARLNKLI